MDHEGRIDSNLALEQAEQFFENGVLLLDEYPEESVLNLVRAVEIRAAEQVPSPEYFVHLAAAYVMVAGEPIDGESIEMYHAALEQLEYAIEDDPNYGQAHHDKAMYLAQLGKIKSAVLSYKDALATTNLPHRAMTYLCLGRVQERLHLWNDALESYFASLRYYPSFCEGTEAYKRLRSMFN